MLSMSVSVFVVSIITSHGLKRERTCHTQCLICKLEGAGTKSERERGVTSGALRYRKIPFYNKAVHVYRCILGSGLDKTSRVDLHL